MHTSVENKKWLNSDLTFDKNLRTGHSIRSFYMKNLKVMPVLIVSLGIILSACTSVPVAPSEVDVKAKNLKPSQDKALLYIYQHDWGHGSNVSVMLDDDDRLIGQLDNDTYVVWPVNPGTHKIAVTSEDLGSKTMQIKINAGQTYYIELWFPRSLTNMIDLRVVDKLVGLKAIKECKLAMYGGIDAALKGEGARERVTDAVMVSTPAKSDVDELPALKIKSNKNAYAIVIGIENYRKNLPKADFAAHDAQIVSEYVRKVMGYPEENVITLINDGALKSDMEKYFDRWLSNNVEENGRVFIYYSGHGAPHIKSRDAYLVAYYSDPTFIAETGYSIARLYESLGRLKAKEITVVLDSCFSGGGGRSVLAKGAKPLVITISTPNINKNIAVMTASAGDQIGSAYEEQGHGLFTYFFLKGIRNENVVQKDGSLKMKALLNYIKPQVEQIARKKFNNEQTPQLFGHEESLKE
jgi:hypothetical protein